MISDRSGTFWNGNVRRDTVFRGRMGANDRAENIGAIPITITTPGPGKPWLGWHGTSGQRALRQGCIGTYDRTEHVGAIPMAITTPGRV